MSLATVRQKMRKLIISLLLICDFLTVAAKPVFADFARLDYPNNKFGIHLAVVSEEDLKDAATLVNSSGGDWGYVTVVFEENDRDREKWQKNFDLMRQLHLIPIVRLATTTVGDTWQKPQKEEAKNWADFLDSLNWVVKNRYVVLFNEPNFAKEWGGKIDARDYGEVATAFAKILKEKSPDFFIMLAGFNGTAPDFLPNYQSEQAFLREMSVSLGGINNVFTDIDGWASHSYEMNTYIKELNFLKRLDLARDLPVFITEAGWPHAEGLNHQHGFNSQETVAYYLQSFFNQVVNDPRVVAITPFILNYQGEPFDHFSWRKPGEPKEFYFQYNLVSQISKMKGNPEQERKLEVIESLPQKLIANSTYQIPIKIKNLGQAIWSKEEGYELKFSQEPENLEYFFSDINKLLPFEEETVWLYLKTKDKIDKADLSFGVAKEGEMASNVISWPMEMIAPLTIDVWVKPFLGKTVGGSDFRIAIYNVKEEMVFSSPGLTIKGGRGELKGVNNLIIGEKYRLVIFKPYFLPQQKYLIVKEEDNKVSFKSMLPLDFNLDGRFFGEDLLTLIKNPLVIRHLLW